jgi:hypothetical protein
LYTCSLQKSGEGVPISGPLLQAQVVEFHKQIDNADDFNATNGWSLRRKICHGPARVSIEGESRSNDSAVAKEFFESLLRWSMSVNIVKNNCTVVTKLHCIIDCFQPSCWMLISQQINMV